MGENKKLKKRRKGLNARVRQHLNLVANEKAKASPDRGLIKCWVKEIAAWEKEIERIDRRLVKDWK